jgi:hypothetical protein
VSATATPVPRSFGDALPEVVTVPAGGNTTSARYARWARAGKLKQLYRGVYSSNLRAEDADVVQRNWSDIVGYLAPRAVVSFRSAFDGKPRDGVVHITRTSGAREFDLPGLAVKAFIDSRRGPILQAERPGARDVPYRELFFASQARGYLENLIRDQRLAPRQLTLEGIEAQLERMLSTRGPKALNSLRDDAREVAQRLEMNAEFDRLDRIVGALLGTKPAHALKTARARARAAGRPFDADRIALFESIATQLRNYSFADIAEPARSGRPRDMFAFVESYYSNFIEGTTFTLEEAEQIVFDGKIFPTRNEDSHDVQDTFQAVHRDPFYSVVPGTEDEYVAWLRGAHALILRGRPHLAPGEWKILANQAGATLFVLPELVEATLRKAWPLFGTLQQPMAKALFAMFVVSEVHPFQDGNGRTARAFMNAYLSSAGECRIIVPTVMREDYLQAIKAMTHRQDAAAYIRVMRLCQAWSAELDYDLDPGEMRAQLQRARADETDMRLYHLLSPRTGARMSMPGLPAVTTATSAADVPSTTAAEPAAKRRRNQGEKSRPRKRVRRAAPTKR